MRGLVQSLDTNGLGIEIRTAKDCHEGDIGRVPPGDDRHHTLDRREARRIDKMPGPVEPDLGDGMKVLRHQIPGIGGDHTGRDTGGTGKADQQMCIIAANALARDKAVGRAGLRHVLLDGTREVELLYAVMPPWWRRTISPSTAKCSRTR